MKQDREIALSAAYQARSEQATELLLAMAGDPAMRSLMIKADQGRIDELTADEIRAGDMYTDAALNYYENVHYQYSSGFLSAEHWDKSRRGLKWLLSAQSTRKVFRESSQSWRKSFRAFAEELIEEIEAEQAERR